MNRISSLTSLTALFSLTALCATAPQARELCDLFLPNDMVFDVGAHVGKKTALYLWYGAGRVICFEPQPRCQQAIETRYQNNPRVVLEKIGLADKPGSVDLYICREADTISTMSEEWRTDSRFTGPCGEYHWDRKITVEVSTLDAMIAKHGLPKFCKIDVENYEYEVIKGLTQPIPYLSFEFHQEMLSHAEQCVRHLAASGYTHFNVGLGEHLAFHLPEWMEPEAFIQLIYKLHETAGMGNLMWGDIYAYHP